MPISANASAVHRETQPDALSVEPTELRIPEATRTVVSAEPATAGVSVLDLRRERTVRRA